MERIREFRQVGKPSELIAALGKLWDQDKQVEALLARNRMITIICLVLFALGIFLLFVRWAWLAVVPAALYFGWRWLQCYQTNLDDRRILTPLKFLEVIQTDISLRSPVRLMVSFEDFKKHGRKLAETKEGASNRMKYEDTWLEVEGWLAEKTRFRLVVSQRISLSEKRKRKYTKRKERLREAVELQLRPSPKLYKALDKFPAQFSAGEMVDGLKVASARAQGRAVMLVAEGGLYTKVGGRSDSESGTENLVHGNKLLTLMAAAFDRLNRCR